MTGQDRYSQLADVLGRNLSVTPVSSGAISDHTKNQLDRDLLVFAGNDREKVPKDVEMNPDDLARIVEEVVRRCQRAGIPRSDAEDYVQDALVALMAKHHAGATCPVERVRAWLSVAAHRKLLDHLRRVQRERNAVARMSAGIGSVPDPGELTVNRALAVWLVEALRELPGKPRSRCAGSSEPAPAWSRPRSNLA